MKVFFSYRSSSENLTASEFKALRHLKVDKGNTIVILDTICYISAIEEILNDHTKFITLIYPLVKKLINKP